VDTVTLDITIDRPREEVFAYLSDVANHPEFSDHYLTDWHLTREDSEGREQLRQDSSDPTADREGKDEDHDDPVHPRPPRGELQRF